MKIDHIQLACPAGGEAAARAFFGTLLGMEEEEKPEALRARGGCWFRKGVVRLHIGVDPEFKAQGKAHPGLSVGDLEALAARLEDASFTVVWDQALANRQRFFTTDPFGNRLEFLASA